MKRIEAFVLLALAVLSVSATEKSFSSPDGHVTVTVSDISGRPTYKVSLDGATFITPSPLGVLMNFGDLSQAMTLKDCTVSTVNDEYELKTIKQSHVVYQATEAVCQFEKGGQRALDVIFRVTGRDVAFRYKIYAPKRDVLSAVVEGEASGFVMPEGTTTFLCPQVKPMGGFARTYPSYETGYTWDDAMGKNGWGQGYTFPCLFRVANVAMASQPNKEGRAGQANKDGRGVQGKDGRGVQGKDGRGVQGKDGRGVQGKDGRGAQGATEGWVIVSETGTDGGYVGCALKNDGGNKYSIAFPQKEEMDGWGTANAKVALPALTPWRTMTLGTTLAPIVETTVANDLVQPKYKASKDYTYGKGTWSWIIRMDNSCNYKEQKEYIDFSAALGYRSVLVDAHWDTQIGYDKVAELAAYAKSKGVGLFLWYNSNGFWNDAPQGPRQKMDRSAVRRKEMKWMQENGILGIKVDFFGGDKQVMMQLYEDILTDANEFGLQCIFHGCTLPRGWERMYPNYVASEAVLASENLSFGQGACDAEAKNGCTHVFIRNSVASMDWGGSALNKRYSTGNDRGSYRRTSDVYALATAVLFQSSVQHFALAPNNLQDAPAWAIDFMKQVPTTWDEVRFLDGYPGKYAIIARRCGDTWYVAGINAEQQPLKKVISLPMFAKDAQLTVYADDPKYTNDPTLVGSVKTLKQNKKQQLTITIPENGGFVVVGKK